MSALSFKAQLPADVRAAIRNGEWPKPTAGLAPGYVQVNFAILPARDAGDFHRFCQKNPKPCPLIAISEIGDPRIPQLGADLDIRTDTPRYRVFRDGKVIDEPFDIREYWRDDLVTFAIGCSFTFEHSLLESGIGIRHIEQNRNVPMYRTNIATDPAGKFHGPMVVSMRPLKAADAIRAIQITSRFPGVHGAPVHIGDPALIGIKDIAKPDYGDAVDIRDDELPVFWACGVTPQSVIVEAKPEFCITHAPGHMLITDLRNSDLSVI
ncbi:putative hydro-lyase [Noviherbaspirillum cavernae]|uniref:Putative hydro-lyase D3870_04105 n=1 Tax=Noviherbaspirillum cavernae TaxID=2320862 RepID=A0A418WYK4_9BURK|nr:putative hydro-lyase [Noviherbaspirillum cavernae]RJG05307.1 putative hydro-lyase [Noviherbaspirillum cavernae]